jgi:hypothetical protein
MDLLDIIVSLVFLIVHSSVVLYVVAARAMKNVMSVMMYPADLANG